MGQPCFPWDYPDTAAGAAELELHDTEERRKAALRPKNRWAAELCRACLSHRPDDDAGHRCRSAMMLKQGLVTCQCEAQTMWLGGPEIVGCQQHVLWSGLD